MVITGFFKNHTFIFEGFKNHTYRYSFSHIISSTSLAHKFHPLNHNIFDPTKKKKNSNTAYTYYHLIIKNITLSLSLSTFS